MAFKKGHIPWNKGIVGYMAGLTPFPKGNVPWNKGLTKATDSRMANASNTMKESHRRKRELNGDMSGIGGKHDRLRREFGRVRQCENCGTTDAKLYDWANLDHKYNSEDKQSWMRLCRKCHNRYDLGKIKIKGLYLVERGGQIKDTIKYLKPPLRGAANLAKRPEIRVKISQSLTNKKMSEQHRESLRPYWESLRKRMAGDNNPAKRPEVRKKILESQRKLAMVK